MKTLSLRRIGIVVKPNITSAWPVVTQMGKWSIKHGIELLVEQHAHTFVEGAMTFMAREEIPQHADLIIVLGGDGTMLATARLIGAHAVPVMGVNFGTLGYLTEFSVEELFPTLDRIIEGNYCLDIRVRLDARVLRNEQCIAEASVLNDVVVNKSALARIIELECWINDQLVNNFRADGLIISTPTGSTAYSLSAGGPLIHPRMHAMAITPICPHALTNRPLVIPDEAPVDLILMTPREEVTLTLDGQIGFSLKGGDRICVRKSEQYFQLIQSNNKNYFQILHEKLNWGG
ncbi:MAG: NAD(+)/NADH kinase [Acidobacteriota bacterium]